MKNKYYAVFYSIDGTIHLWPGDTQEECLSKLSKMLEDPKMFDRCESTTVIKRDMDRFNGNYIFGNPKSLNAKK